MSSTPPHPWWEDRVQGVGELEENKKQDVEYENARNAGAETQIHAAELQRHHVQVDINADLGLYYWEACLKVKKRLRAQV